MPKKTAIIIGGGPAGLTAAFELLQRTDIVPIVLEKSEEYLGGISRTVNYKGNRIDIGGHRFFSKSDRVMDWWLDLFPLESVGLEEITYHQQKKELSHNKEGVRADPSIVDTVMLIRQRKSRIYYNGNFFEYPIQLSFSMLRKLGVSKVLRIAIGYLKSMLFPIKNEKNLEEFFINRFGNELYRTFFKSYTEKVWGTSCENISAEWGAQRIKGLSVGKALLHMLKKMIPKRKGIKQKSTETSLIEQFLYPKFGPGQMWEEVGRLIEERGGKILMGHRVVGIKTEDNKIISVTVLTKEESRVEFAGDYFFSGMPIRELVQSMDPLPSAEIKDISDGLLYRDFITVGLLVDKKKIRHGGEKNLTDNWIYIHDPQVNIGRLQIFNNWSPYMVADKNTLWLGLEYFCNEESPLWTMTNEKLLALGERELMNIGIIEEGAVLDGTVLRVEKAYPAYFGSFNRFEIVRNFLDSFHNLFPVGRNGMHRYNNQDHSMLTAMIAVDNIVEARVDKSNMWEVNTEEEYHEKKDS